MNLQWYDWLLWVLGMVTIGYTMFAVIWYTRGSGNIRKEKSGKRKTRKKR